MLSQIVILFPKIFLELFFGFERKREGNRDWGQGGDGGGEHKLVAKVTGSYFFVAEHV